MTAPGLNSEHVRQVFVTVVPIVLASAALLVGATLWIDSSIHAVSDASAARDAGMQEIFVKIQTDNEKRLTKLEVRQDDIVRILNDTVLRLGELSMQAQRRDGPRAAP